MYVWFVHCRTKILKKDILQKQIILNIQNLQIGQTSHLVAF